MPGLASAPRHWRHGISFLIYSKSLGAEKEREIDRDRETERERPRDRGIERGSKGEEKTDLMMIK